MSKTTLLNDKEIRKQRSFSCTDEEIDSYLSSKNFTTYQEFRISLEREIKESLIIKKAQEIINRNQTTIFNA